MISVTSAQLEAWLSAFLYPFFRILAWLAADPLLGNRAAPAQVRVALAFMLTVALAPALPPPPAVPLISGDGLLILIQQLLIGLALGFALRIVFAALELAGQFIGLQMGLSFATLVDPIHGAQTPVLAQFLIITAVLILFAFDGHHMILTALVESFHALPVAVLPLSGTDLGALVAFGGTIFTLGLKIALPVTAALLVTNLAIGMMTRAAPQLNIFAVGFPLTLAAGLLVLHYTVVHLPQALEQLWGEAGRVVADLFAAGRAP
ncbi:MAG: flagellar biosynthetic protein FliR [Thiobacillaceae bacterium]|nr:flagellar biosynthetic protein FliR [Thiobacillaceae bacterium]MDW8322752.1 flagellar biosynthetic protein FliR [Burkholderiales bacterium]